MNRTILRTVVMIIAVSGLSACGALQQSPFFQQDFWTFMGSKDNNKAELGLAELAKGDNVLAQSYFVTALKSNPNDVQALYGLAVLYQNTGQPTRARQLYEQILSIRPVPNDRILIWADNKTQPIIDVAQVNMQLLSSGGLVPMDDARGQPGTQESMIARPNMSEMPTERPPLPRGMSSAPVQAQPLYARPSFAPQRAVEPAPVALFKEADLNIVARFKTMRSLLDQGLITQDEFLRRRQMNVGALLPLSSRPPATGLERPVPSSNQVSGRLRAIARALEMRAISPSQHTAERTMILDALMPVRPSSVRNPMPPPKGLMEAADAVRRLEMLQQADLITSDEYAKERAAIERSMQPNAPPPLPGSQSAQKSNAAAKPALSGFQPAVHLASYRKKKSAMRGWRQLSKRFGSLLSGLETSIERVDLGRSKGVFYRLKAGPLPSNDAAKKLCRKLKSKRQFCDPTTINFG